MISEEEKQEIINIATERMLLIIPEVIGNLMTKHAIMSKINTKFYSDYPEFRDHRDIVAAVIESEEAKNPTNDYEKLLRNSVNEIKKRIAITKSIPNGEKYGNFR